MKEMDGIAADWRFDVSIMGLAESKNMSFLLS
jgi:hypothetical protein